MKNIKLLEHANIPKPLHGLNPRTLMGKEKWDIIRKKVYAHYNYACACCQIHKSKAKKHQWMEAHEIYEIDYKNGIAKIVKIVALCHYCHAFIHSGLQYVLCEKGEISRIELIDKMKHGIELLASIDGSIFEGTLEICNLYQIDTKNLKTQELPKIECNWEDWKLIMNNKEYKGNFKNIEDWYQHYN